MAKPKRQAAKRASSKLESVQVLSDGGSASSFEADSPLMDGEDSELGSDIDELGDFQVEEAEEEITQPVKPKRKKRLSMNFVENKQDGIIQVFEAEEGPVDNEPPRVQKFAFHNSKYTPKLQLEDKVFEKFQNALLTQIPKVKEVGDVIHLSMTNGRLPCPLINCGRSFLNFEGIKYHCQNFVHYYECLGLEDSECDMSRDYWPIIIPWLIHCKPRKKPANLGFIIGFPSTKNEIDESTTTGVKTAKKDRKKLSLFRNQDVTVDKFHPKNLTKHFLPNLLTQPTLSKTTVFYKHEKETRNVRDYYEYSGDGYSADKVRADIISLPEIQDLDIKVKNDKFKIKGFQSQKFDSPHTHFIVNCGLFVKCIEWIDNYIAVGGETDENIDGLLQVYKVTKKNVDLKILINHKYGTVTACKWCLDSYIPGARLGFLAASFGDGGMRVLDIPYVEELQILEVSKPLFEFVPKGYSILSLAWENKKNWIACGTDHGIATSNLGHIMIYDFSKTAENQLIPPRLINFNMIHDSSILKLDFIVTPDGTTYLLSTGLDGRTCLSPVLDFLNPLTLTRTSGPCFAQTYSKLMDVFVYTDNENRVRMSPLSNDAPAKILARCLNTPWDVDLNHFCTYLTIASGEGLCYVNVKRSIGRGVNIVMVPVYEIDVDGDEKTFKNGLPLKELKVRGDRPENHNMKSYRTGVYVAKFNQTYEERGVIASGGDGFLRIDRILKSFKEKETTPT